MPWIVGIGFLILLEHWMNLFPAVFFLVGVIVALIIAGLVACIYYEFIVQSEWYQNRYHPPPPPPEPVPFSLPEHLRFQGTWIIAPPGAGKTNLLKWLVTQDIQRVLDGKASVIILDSKGDLINPVRRLQCFGPDDISRDRLIYIDPNPEFPPALNPFKLSRHFIDTDAERTHTIELLEYVFSGMNDFAFTQTQSTCFIKIVSIVLTLPKPSFVTLRNFLNDDWEQYRSFLSASQLRFMEHDLQQRNYKESRTQISARLDNILERYPILETMFSADENKVDISDAMNSGKVVLINTNHARLGDGKQMFGRLFIAMVRQAAALRATLPKSKWLPVYFYIDECSDYVSTDKKIADILDQCRSFNIAPILAHQRLRQLKLDEVQEALGNCAIKFANTEENAAELASRFHVTPIQLKHPTGTFSVNFRGQNTVDISFSVQEMLSMTDQEDRDLIHEMRLKYASVPEPPLSKGLIDTEALARKLDALEQSTPPNDLGTDDLSDRAGPR